ncbi:MAG: SMP-30/gluconolactonase/LRE family protein [Chitinophagaceae bacterium]|nr:SMP-30/gluconolactonase/LRE family protein [Chitinophagaceae bacterium]
MNVTIELDCRNDLGEGPVWDYPNHKLMWVDYNQGKVCSFHLQTKEYAEVQVADTVMVAIPTNRGNWILAIEKQIVIYDPVKRSRRKEATIVEENPDNRLNDGKCDGLGRLWISTMSNTANIPTGALYRINADLGYEKMDEPFIIPNGIAWNRKSTRMFIVDSQMKKIFCYDFDLNKGSIKNKQVLIDTSSEPGLPDGMTIDENDNLWVACWQGQTVCCYDTLTGALLTRIRTPAMIPSSCCFGGDDLSTLFITSSRKYDNEENIKRFPFSGGLFSVKPGVRGVQGSFFIES